ncbi:SpoIIE family protein phosphatase [Streptomyces sp. NPDC093089]|uniref:SpoIIE family protein phosphatase n=1 Tax=Streptomyces sp. NPDC093089 TaxID=3366024 RepID=UPI0037F42273
MPPNGASPRVPSPQLTTPMSGWTTRATGLSEGPPGEGRRADRHLMDRGEGGGGRVFRGPLLSLRGITKHYGGVVALDSVDLEVDRGQVLGLVGDSGAGKSTLVKAVSGVAPPDAGVIEWRGVPVELTRPVDAQRLGISTVFQDPSLVDRMDVVANLYLGRELRRFGVLRQIEIEKRSIALLDRLAITLPDIRVPVSTLTLGERQTVAIARALLGRPQLVVLDEPTATLTVEQTSRMLDLIRRLSDLGHAVIMVSHNLDDVQAVADRIAVLRLGSNGGVFDARYTSQEQLAAAISGGHPLAVTLQQSLLPRGLPAQDAVEAAHRYLPAHAGVGGDWFDVVPLSGARVALVVGDVVGHGLHAAATMGRLRTAVHNLAILDLPPDELLTRLDEVVARIDEEQTAGGREDAVIGATCLYAIYDPVTCRCQLARAGHLPPILVSPDGTTDIPDTPAGPPLGLRGLPFTTIELDIPEGSQLVLYTDGLVESRTRDIDVGLDRLRAALAHPGRTPEQTCQAVLTAMLPADSADDIALLIARTKALPADRIAEWNVPPDPSAVAASRAAATVHLRRWGLDDLVLGTELILSELVTNAIRYGAAPIGVRLIYARTLICQVADASSTSPRVRLAADTDEGGRGLFLVGQIAQRWGTRYTETGKIIWTEQHLP